MTSKLTVQFSDIAEIRMGSPFNRARLALKGVWVPALPNDNFWQDITAESKDGRFVGLVQWRQLPSGPGFVIVTADTREKKTSESERVDGCCKKIWWDDEAQKFAYERFLKEK